MIQEKSQKSYLRLSPFSFYSLNQNISNIVKFLQFVSIEYEQLQENEQKTIIKLPLSSLNAKIIKNTETKANKEDDKKGKPQKITKYFIILRKEQKEHQIEIQIIDKDEMSSIFHFLTEGIIKLKKVHSFSSEKSSQLQISIHFEVSKTFIYLSQFYRQYYDKKQGKPGRQQFIKLIEKLIEKHENLEDMSNKNIDIENKMVKISKQNEIKQVGNQLVSLNFEDQNVGLYFDLSDQKIPPTSTPKTFNGSLQEYQKLALTWMLFREDAIKQLDIDGLQNSTGWKNLKSIFRIKENIYVNTMFNKISQKIPLKQCKGGILGDEMGLGKTIMMISLILTIKENNSKHVSHNTLIIGTVSILEQWKKQINKFAPSLTVYMYGAIGQNKDEEIFLENYDVTLITKDVLRNEKISLDKNEFEDDSKNLFNFQWYRVVVDQAHIFKNRNTKMMDALCSLQARYRWCMTGTPAQNSFNDIYSLVKFLKFEPWCDFHYWECFFPQKINYSRKKHYKMAKQLLKGIMIRRKKNSKNQKGEVLVKIPEVDIKIHFVEMEQKARDIYLKFNKSVKQYMKEIQNYEEERKNSSSALEKKIIDIFKKGFYLNVFQKITRLRQISCHYFLCEYQQNYILHKDFQKQYIKFLKKSKIKKLPKTNFFQAQILTSQDKKNLNVQTNELWKVYDHWRDIINDLSNQEKFPCLLCKEKPSQGMITPCLHIFCKKCIQENLKRRINQKQVERLKEKERLKKKESQKREKFSEAESSCPVCGDPLKLKELFALPVLNCFDKDLAEFEYNEKILSLLKYLRQMFENETDKAVVYTSFLGMVTLLRETFRREKMEFLTMQGSDSFEERAKKMERFQTSQEVRIFVITLGTGSIGINLQAANKVFFMDPWWNPAVEEQAISRVHRQGQEKKVDVVKFITNDSIQVRVMKLGLKKRNLADSILDIDDVEKYSKEMNKKQQIRFLLNLSEEHKSEEIQEQEQEMDEQNQKNDNE